MAHVWPWAHDPHLRAVLCVSHLAYVAARSISVLGELAKGQPSPMLWSNRLEINFKRGYLAELCALRSWPKASRPCVMVQPATVGKITLFKKIGSVGVNISSCNFGRYVNKVLGKGACGMKKYLVQKKEELIVDLN